MAFPLLILFSSIVLNLLILVPLWRKKFSVSLYSGYSSYNFSSTFTKGVVFLQEIEYVNLWSEEMNKVEITFSPGFNTFTKSSLFILFFKLFNSFILFNNWVFNDNIYLSLFCNSIFKSLISFCFLFNKSLYWFKSFLNFKIFFSLLMLFEILP